MSDFQPMKHLDMVAVADLLESDALKDMLQKQYELVKKFYAPNIEEMIPKDRNDYSVRVSIALEDEISELRGQLNWKWWKKPHQIDETELKFEIVDIFFFTLTLMVVWKMTPEEVYSYYLTKHKENVRRQENGY